jgi:cation transporter-like permease
METQDNTTRQNASGKILFAIAFGLTGGLAGYFGAHWIKSNTVLQYIGPQGAIEKILFVALAFFAIWLVIALHELGHLYAGLAQGFRLALYTAGFLGIRGTEYGAQLFFNRDVNLMGGLAATFPEEVAGGPELRRKFARIVIAGPLTSLLVAIAAFAAGIWLYQPGSTPATLLLRATISGLFVTGFMSSLIFLATSAPIPSQGFMTDGRRFLSLLSGGAKGLREEAGLAVMSLMGAGKLPGEYPADLLPPLLSLPPGNLLGVNGNFIAFTHYLDRGETEQALSYAQTVESNIQALPAGPFRRYYLKDIVFFYAFIVRDAEKARLLWATIERNAEKDQDAAAYRAKAALALLDGKFEEAAAFVNAGLRKISDLPFHGQRRFEEKWLGKLMDQVSKSSTDPQPV